MVKEGWLTMIIVIDNQSTLCTVCERTRKTQVNLALTHTDQRATEVVGVDPGWVWVTIARSIQGLSLAFSSVDSRIQIYNLSPVKKSPLS